MMEHFILGFLISFIVCIICLYLINDDSDEITQRYINSFSYRPKDK